jgi:hypothetical protein
VSADVSEISVLIVWVGSDVGLHAG